MADAATPAPYVVTTSRGEAIEPKLIQTLSAASLAFLIEVRCEPFDLLLGYLCILDRLLRELHNCRKTSPSCCPALA